MLAPVPTTQRETTTIPEHVTTEHTGRKRAVVVFYKSVKSKATLHVL